ncbi:C-C motif chemokine 3-like [Mugil cephalus]|uniref:C-C motif chemokine 3-like n=1 Tax=Mugil cephalus TaxID=48193 RepID=UPI001FB7D3B6|nr:C-C motif chemokine 3-like [Mugil cephalus]
MKKSLSFIVGLMLLLFTVQRCSSITVAMGQIPPERCCFEFLKGEIPRRAIASISTTDSRCPEPAFLIKTVKNKEFCVRQSSTWAQKVYEEGLKSNI